MSIRAAFPLADGIAHVGQSLVESSGALRSKSARYVGVTAMFNLAVVAVIMAVPLLYPEALPNAAMTAMLTAPSPPPAAAPLRPQIAVKAVQAVAPLNAFVAPSTVPKHIDMSHDAPPQMAASDGIAGMTGSASGGAAIMDAIGLAAAPPVVVVKSIVPKAKTVARVSAGVIAGNKISGATPIYPAIARAAHVSGAVVLHAVISKMGTVESLQVVSGHEMLRASALQAVQSWRYRAYLLNGEPTEVDTTITVNFTFGG